MYFANGEQLRKELRLCGKAFSAECLSVQLNERPLNNSFAQIIIATRDSNKSGN